MPDHEIAQLCDSTASIVGRYRRKHNISAYEGYKFGKGQEPPSKTNGKPKKRSDSTRTPRSRIDAYRDEVGKVPDALIAEKAGVTVEGVRMYRRRHSIPLEDGARKRRGAEEAADVAVAEDAEAATRNRRSKIDPFRDQVGKVPDGEIAALAEVTLEAVRAYRRKHDIPAEWRQEEREEDADARSERQGSRSPAPPRRAPAGRPRASDAEGQGYAVAIRRDGEVSDHVIIAADIADAAARAVAAAGEGRLSGEIVAIRHLGPAFS